MSYQVDNLCFTSKESALSYMAASMHGVDSAGVPYSARSDGAQIIVESASFTNSFTPNIEDCQLITASDAAVYCSGIVLCFVIAFCYRLLRVQIHDSGE
jgi:hypothetical protein